jgi:hypothetical protein
MTDLLTPLNNVIFTVTKQPRREAERKTIQRLMRLQPHIQKGMKALQRKRRQHDNITRIRAGVEWTNRVKATNLTRVEPGATFTLQIAPQIIPDIKSVEKYLDMKAG